MRALILAGGSGKECLPLSSVVPKTMLFLHGKPILEYVINGLVDTGINSLIIVKGYLGHVIDPLIEKTRERGIHVDVVDQGPIEGIENVILSCKQFLDEEEPFILAYGDILTSPDFYHHLLNTYYNSSADAAISVILWGRVESFGVVSIDSFGNVEKLTPTTHDLDQPDHVYAGASILPREFLDILEEEKTINKTINRMIEENRRISASIWDKEWADIGNPWDLLKANENLFKDVDHSYIHESVKISPTAHVSGTVIIEENVVIDHNAQIVGPCYIGKNSYIGTNTLIREKTSIENNCSIGYSVEIKNSVIQPKTKIGRLSFIGDSVIGHGAEIGSGITTMNVLKDEHGKRKRKIIKGVSYAKLGAVIGPKSTLGANVVIKPNSIIRERVIIPPGSVIEKDHKMF